MQMNIGAFVFPPKTGTHHEEGVANPQAPPPQGTLWDGDVLTVNRNGN